MAKRTRRNRLWLARFPFWRSQYEGHARSINAAEGAVRRDVENAAGYSHNWASFFGNASLSIIEPLNLPIYRPMDPLSFAASIITVISVAATIAEQLNLLQKSLRDASGLLSALMNEISDLRIILESCRTAVADLYRTSSSPNPPTPLSDVEQVLNRTKLHLTELEKVVRTCLGNSSDPLNAGRGVKIRWLREKGKAELLQSKLRDSKQNLMMLLESQSVSAMSGMQIAVQEISVGTTEFHTSSTEKMDQILYQLSDHMSHIREINLKNSQFNEKLNDLGQIKQDLSRLSLEPPPYSQRVATNDSSDSHRPSNSAIQLRASCYRKSCRPWCSCRCHVRREIRSPGLAKSFMGSLFIGYSGVPIVTPECNEKQCRKRSTSRIILSYQFPEWFWERSLFTSFMTASLSGPEMLIRVSNTIPYACETYQHCVDGNVSGLQRLFEIGKASPFDLDPEGVSLLHNALKFNHFDLCHLLISSGSDLYQEDHTGLSAFHYAWDAILIDPEEPRSSKKKQALLEIFPQDEGGLDERQFNRTHKSVLGIIGTHLVDELAISTSTIDTVDNLGRTPLFWAARRGDSEATRLLLEHGARTTSQQSNRKGTSPLLAAAQRGNVEIIKQLLQHGADVDVRTVDNLSPLHYAATLEEGCSCVEVLLEAGADVNSMDDEDRTPLLTATSSGCTDIAELLLTAGARIDQTCEDGWTALTSCIFWNMHQSVKLLLDKGASTALVTDQGETLLHVALRYGDTKMLEMLSGFDLRALAIDAKTLAGETVQEIADSRDESPEWRKAYEVFLSSIVPSKSTDVGITSVLIVGDGEVGSYGTIEDPKVIQQVVETYTASDDGSDYDHFEDAVEILV